MTMLGEDIHGKTLGIAGFGRIGQAVAQRATGFGMKILYYDPVVQAEDAGRWLNATSVDLNTLLRESDFVSVHTPLTPETRHMIGKEQFDLMKDTAYLINTSRGPVLDESALASALKAHRIRGAALDVFENEPEIYPALLQLDSAVITPHIASASVATRGRMALMAAENVIAALGGQRPPSLVNDDLANG